MVAFKKINLKYLFLLLWIIGGCVKADAQEIKILSFQKLERDIFPRTNPRYDLNDNQCSVIRFITGIKGLEFDGNVIGEPLEFAGETIVYVTKGTKRLTVRHPDYGLIRYEFPEKIEEKTSYEVKLKFKGNPKNKRKTFVLAGANFTNEYIVPNVMIGFVKKWGWYIKGAGNFKHASADEGVAIEINNNGLMADGTPAWTTSEAMVERMAITAGAVFRTFSNLYIYAGAGYGNRNIIYESTSSERLFKNMDKSYTGIEAETGFIFNLKNIAIRAGIQSTKFKTMEVSVGAGYIF